MYDIHVNIKMLTWFWYRPI